MVIILKQFTFFIVKNVYFVRAKNINGKIEKNVERIVDAENGPGKTKNNFQ